jgi:outer membrane protein assembly factor BamB
MGGGNYKAATPIVDGQTLIVASRGVKALKFEKDGDKFTATELWSNPDKSVQFNTPALKNGMLYGLAGNNEIFCINAKDGKTAWGTPFPSANAPAPAGAAAIRSGAAVFGLVAQADPPPADPGRPGGRGPGGPGAPGGGRRGGGGMGGGAGYGSIVDAGSVVFAITPGAQLVVFEPSDKEFKQVASYKVGSQIYAYPVASGNRIFIKDRDSVILWTVE